MAGQPSSFRARGGIWAVAQLTVLTLAMTLGPLTRESWESHRANKVGRALLILSAAFAISGFLALGKNLSPFPQPSPGATLVRHGVYRLVRHPLYSSLILGSLGWSLMWRSVPGLASALVLAVLLDAKSRVEERWLRQRFTEYADYERRVRRFIPWIY